MVAKKLSSWLMPRFVVVRFVFGGKMRNWSRGVERLFEGSCGLGKWPRKRLFEEAGSLIVVSSL